MLIIGNNQTERNSAQTNCCLLISVRKCKGKLNWSDRTEKIKWRIWGLLIDRHVRECNRFQNQILYFRGVYLKQSADFPIAYLYLLSGTVIWSPTALSNVCFIWIKSFLLTVLFIQISSLFAGAYSLWIFGITQILMWFALNYNESDYLIRSSNCLHKVSQLSLMNWFPFCLHVIYNRYLLYGVYNYLWVVCGTGVFYTWLATGWTTPFTGKSQVIYLVSLTLGRYKTASEQT